MTLPELPKRFHYHTSQPFNHLKTIISHQLQCGKIALFAFIDRYWFRLIILCFFVGILCLKEVTIKFQWQGKIEELTPSETVTPIIDQTAVTPPPVQSAEVKVVNLKSKKQIKYVTRFAKVAQAEMEKYGIPASITLAQGLLETNAGDSPLATQLNNHFGIKCFSKKCQKGHCANFSDDTHKDFFRAYDTAWESFRAHSKLLQSKRYQSLYHLPKRDYVAWAKGLKKAGYATDQQYPEKLVRLIEDLNLQQYDS